jgi:hypothetical protein
MEVWKSYVNECRIMMVLNINLGMYMCNIKRITSIFLVFETWEICKMNSIREIHSETSGVNRRFVSDICNWSASGGIIEYTVL